VGRLAARLVATSVVVALSAPLALVGSSSAATAPLPTGSSGGATLEFSDNFNGTSLNTTKWHTCQWWATTTCSIETNNELELYTKNNVSVANGVLKLQGRRESAVGWNGNTYDYTSGMISSGGRSGETAPGFTFTYGYVEARVKVPRGQGLWPAFWMLPADHSWPPEIDAMEILGNQPDVSHMTYHYLDGTGAQAAPGATWAGPDFSAGWHTFGVDWQPSAITWYIDGVERWRFTDAAAITNKASYVLLNLAVGGSWPGSPDASTVFPADFLVDYVRVWDRFGTPTQPPPPTSSYAAAVVGDHPAAYWRLGESGGALAADAVANNTGTYRNGAAVGSSSLLRSDPQDTAVSFDGVNDAVTVPNSPGLSPTAAVTVEAWVRPSVVPGAGTFASVVTKAESYSLQFNGGRLEFTTMQNGTRRRVQAAAGAIVAGQTYHVVGTYDGAVQRLFVNGSQVASGAFSGALSTTTNSLVMGSWDAGSEFLTGVVDEVAVYPTVLSATQIASHYAQGSGA